MSKLFDLEIKEYYIHLSKDYEFFMGHLKKVLQNINRLLYSIVINTFTLIKKVNKYFLNHDNKAMYTNNIITGSKLKKAGILHFSIADVNKATESWLHELI